MIKTESNRFMLKSVFGILTVAMMSLFTSCTNADDSTEPIQPKKVEAKVSKAPEFFVSSGSNIFVGNLAGSRAASDISYVRENYHWDAPLDIFKHFPEFVTPEGCFDDFLYVSNGQPFDLVMLYSNGGYRHTMGIYWYEGTECHEQELWDENPDEQNHYWVNFNGTDSKGAISRVDDRAGAYRIQLPAGTRFGFYCHSTLYGEEVVEKHQLTPGGPEEECIAKFYTEQQKNWTYALGGSTQKPLTSQAMTTNINGWTIVGFEDVAITKYSCDLDYNDCVFAMNPAQAVDGSTYDNSVEVNLSVNDQHEQGDYIATKLSIHVRAITDVDVFIPVSKNYYCQADDMDISASHEHLDIVYNTTPQYVDMKIGKSTVKLTVTYTDNGIHVTTDGINEEVINYCDASYKDGITFEVWNYFNESIDRGTLKGMLDNSTVTFIGDQPDAYINAFGHIDEVKNPWDCIVVPTNTSYRVSSEEGQLYNVKYIK